MPVQPPKQSARPRFWERIWLNPVLKDRGKSEENKTAPVDGSRQPIPAERTGELVVAPPDDDGLGTAVAAH
jgi:hypothetical protein